MSEEQKPDGNEPERTKRKSRKKLGTALRQLSVKQKKLLEGIAEGKTQKDAAISAGYSPNNPDQSAYQALQQIEQVLRDEIVKQGLTPAAVIEKYLVPGMGATKFDRVKFLGSFGVEKEDPDWSNRRAFLELWGQWMGLGKGDGQHDTAAQHPTIVIYLGFLGPTRAAEVLAGQPRSGTAS